VVLGRVGSAAFLVLGLFASRVARAQAQHSPLERYRVPPGCAPADAFSAQIAARTPLFRSGDVSVNVEVESRADGVHGHVSIARGARDTEREIAGASCDEVVEALALIVAISLDPNANIGPLPNARPVAPGPVAPGPVAPGPERLHAPAREPAHVSPQRWRLEPGFGFDAEGALAPRLALGPRLFLRLARSDPGALVSSLAVSAARLGSGSIHTGPEELAAFTLVALRFEACSFGFASGALRLEPCLVAEGGSVAAAGTHPRGSRTAAVGWAAGGALGRASFDVLNALSVQAAAGAVFPLSRYRFGFVGEPPVYETASAGFLLGLGFAVKFR
jgi:hypothetical protein